MDNYYKSLFKLRKVYPEVRKKIPVNQFYIDSVWESEENRGEVVLSYEIDGVIVKFIGIYTDNYHEYKIYTRFNNKDTEYQEIHKDTMLSNQIPALSFIREICTHYTLRKIIQNAIIYN